MTSTSFNVGLGSGSRNSSKVLKPPGGGSSDIFGASAAEAIEPQRKMRNHLTSSIFAEESVNASRNKSGNDSFYNLFGNYSETRPESAVNNNLKSNIILSEPNILDNDGKKCLIFDEGNFTTMTDSASDQFQPESFTKGETNGTEHNTGDDNETSRHQQESNSVTVSSEKVETTVVNGGSSSSTNSVASTPSVPAPTPAAVAAGRQRVPPGGFSSGLW